MGSSTYRERGIRVPRHDYFVPIPRGLAPQNSTPANYSRRAQPTSKARASAS